MALSCGHPDACLETCGDESLCGWCEQVRQLREEIAALRSVLNEKAVVISGGDATVGGPIGLLEVRGGIVTFAPPIAFRGQTLSTIHFDR